MSAAKSFQQLDPVGGYSTRPLTVLYCVAIIVYACVQTTFAWNTLNHPALEVLALVCIAVAAAGVFAASAPMRAPFPTIVFVAVVAIALGAMLLDAASSWENVDSPVGQWGPIGPGTIILALAPYRPWRQLLVAAIVSVLLAGAVVAIHPTDIDDPMLVTMVTLVLPLGCFAFGGVAYSRSLASGARWTARAVADGRGIAQDQLDGVLRSVHADRVTILNRDVIPFFVELLEHGRITVRDRDRALAISDGIRSVMVAEADRSWLDTVLERIALSQPEGYLPGGEVVLDDERLAPAMTPDQRTVLRALLVALFEHPGFDPDGFGILIESEGAFARLTLTTKLDSNDAVSRGVIGAYLAVMRIVFTDLHVAFQLPTLTLRFCYDK